MSKKATPFQPNPALDLPRLLERMHRRYLDLVRIHLANLKADDISPVQFMMMQNIYSGGLATSTNEISVRDLIERGYYLGSNASYNLKQLVDRGYVSRSAAARDKRTARLKLSDKGNKLFAAMRQMDMEIIQPLMDDDKAPDSFDHTNKLLRLLERRWSEAIRQEEDPADNFDF